MQISPTAACLPSSSALVETVVPWTMRSTRAMKSGSASPYPFAASASAFMKPCSKAPGVDGVLKIRRSWASSATTQSVNVPPMSMQTR